MDSVTSETSETSAVSAAPDVSGASGISGISGIPDTPGLSGAQDAPGVSRPPRHQAPLAHSAETGLKIVVVGGFGVGKTTLVRSVSEIRPLNTEEVMTQAGIGVDEPAGPTGKTTTTVAFDFGRISLNERLVLYLFGAPGQERFWFLWDRLFSGTLGAVVLVDTRRVSDSWYAIDRLEHHRTPFVVAVNRFDGDHPVHSLDEVRQALSLDPRVPMIDCDARVRSSGKQVLINLVDHLRALATARETTPWTTR
ncbi:GTP-binding protein [Streptomyces yaizuensis]|uniref:ATP/GTP-binding protein n=1 Tax=Streptomyces yaizuensis TaxID=2989713 RepID=A0ABQ5P0F7_9ACTN|nr:ATP/GTP-binding protein [Streptomyces sp. YSPA8]GLF95706.1 ATP/GTP-binding protein [Streptomyces sp. YSPA8]